MSISKSLARFLVRKHKEQKFSGKLLALGKQFIYATHDEIVDIFRQEDSSYCYVVPQLQNISKEKKHQNFIDDLTFFKMLGFDSVHSLDISSYQGAEILWDLNKPIPGDLEKSFDFILNGGTIEHVFDIRQCLDNLSNALKMGGTIFHVAPVDGYLDHGFVQPSPKLFHSYYKSNSFEEVCSILIENTVDKVNYDKWNYWEWNAKIARRFFISERPLMFIYAAKKNNLSTVGVIPIETFDGKNYDRDTNSEESPWGLKLIDIF